MDERLIELKELCNQYPPDMKRIEEELDKIDDFSVFYSAYGPIEEEGYVWIYNDFLAAFISEYLEVINKDRFGYYTYDSIAGEWHFNEPKEEKTELNREHYAVDIIRLFLRKGYDMRAVDGKVGASCLDALVYSNFNDDMVEVARMLMDAGANPFLEDEDGDSPYESLLCHDSGDLGYEDPYLDNDRALMEFYILCQELM